MSKEQAIIPDDLTYLSDIEYGLVGNYSLKLDVFYSKNKNENQSPCIVWIHGGGWRFGDKKDTVHRMYGLAREGYTCATINYRPTNVEIFPAQIQDCKLAIQFLKKNSNKFRIDSTKIGVWGGSAGGQLAALLGTTGDTKKFESPNSLEISSEVQAVCSWFGAFDLLTMEDFPEGVTSRIPHMTADSLDGQLVGGNVNEVGQIVHEVNPSTHISGNEPPFLLMHGALDDFVPVSQSRTLHESLIKAGLDSTLFIIRDGMHNGVGFKDHHIQMVKDFFDWHLRSLPSKNKNENLNNLVQL